MDLASIYFGLFMGIFVFTLTKVVEQTRTIWRRTRSISNAYLYMIWVEAWVNFVFAIVTFLYLNEIIPGSLAFYLGTVTLWAIQTQLLLQIIANRVSLIMTSKRKATMLKWGLFIAVSCINIGVSVIWTSAHLPSTTPDQITLNIIFEKFEKCFFLVVDLGLNLYFLYLVRFRLIADGLSKYWTLFKFNAAIVAVSTSMDILLLGFLSLPDPYLYVQFAPVAYIVKLYIELTMAMLISKVVRSGAAERGDRLDASGSHKSNPSRYLTSRVVISGGPAVPKSGNTFFSKSGKDLEASGGSSGSETHLAPYGSEHSEHGIVKTVETMVVVDSGEDAHSENQRSRSTKSSQDF